MHGIHQKSVVSYSLSIHWIAIEFPAVLDSFFYQYYKCLYRGCKVGAVVDGLQFCKNFHETETQLNMYPYLRSF